MISPAVNARTFEKLIGIVERLHGHRDARAFEYLDFI